MKIAVLGGGESGVGAAILGTAKGHDVFLSDFGPIEHEKKNELIAHEIDFEEGQHTFEKLEKAELVIKSPGISDDTKVVRHLIGLGIRVISEIEWAFIHVTAPVLAITGSNGKTTTTLLCHHLLTKAGIEAECVGNVGTSMSRLVSERTPEWWVVEVSSFQLDNIESFRPNISILLNITPDHLDRYPTFMDYARAKWNITLNQSADDKLIYVDSEVICDLRNASPTAALTTVINEADCESGQVRVADKEWRYSNAYLKGAHNAQNVACAITASLAVGLSSKDIQDGIDTFVNVSHRMEAFATWKEGVVVNDSKATNVDATEKALDSFEGPIIWIAGGTDKGNDYSRLLPLARQRVTSLIAMGLDNSKLLKAFSDHVDDIVDCDSLEKAVDEAMKRMKANETVLLSPACASFDLFKNYEDRGDRFKKAVISWIDEHE